tara:strand:- start:310 stop:780 length:471 start_codon:yes stop_codon:yes gene_type:complete
MSIITTGLMKQQLMAEPTDLAMSSPMEGGVNRPSMAGDLASAMHDVDFRNLMEQYSAMAGTSTNTPMTTKFMQEETPFKERIDTETGKPLTQIQEDIMDEQMFGEARTPVIDPAQMPSLEGTKFDMPVLETNPNPTGLPETELSPGLMTNPFAIKI